MRSAAPALLPQTAPRNRRNKLCCPRRLSEPRPAGHRRQLALESSRHGDARSRVSRRTLARHAGRRSDAGIVAGTRDRAHRDRTHCDRAYRDRAALTDPSDNEPLRTEPGELTPLEPETSESGSEPTPSPLGSEPAPLDGETPDYEPPTRSELPIPSGDLSEGISTKPGGPGCKDNAEQCIGAIRELQQRDITTIIAGVVIEGVEGQDYPCDCKIGRDYDAPKFAGRNFAPTLFTWKATGTCHKPLYFEDVQLERYGHSWNPVVQPFASAAHFFVSVPLLPYKMGLTPPNECMYTLGYYRPGNCAPYMFEPLPLSLRAAMYEGAAATAFAFWFWPPH